MTPVKSKKDWQLSSLPRLGWSGYQGSCKDNMGGFAGIKSYEKSKGRYVSELD